MNVETPDINVKELVEEVEKLLQEAKEIPEYLGDINWTRLRVENVERSITLWPTYKRDERPYIIVTISPAEPAGNLEVWLTDHLDKKKFTDPSIRDIYFECEW